MIHILIINWNGIEDTKKCIDSILESDFDKYKIYVLDNASKTDESSILNSTYKEQINIYRSEKNLGFTGGNNYLFKKLKNVSENDLIFLLNNDTKLDKNCLNEISTSMNKKNKDFIACKMLNMQNPKIIDSCGHNLLNCYDSIPIGFGQIDKSKFRNGKEVIGACGGGMVIRKKILNKTGLFHDHFFLNYEDVDLSLRIILYGTKCYFEPKAIIYHKRNASIGKVRDIKMAIKSQKNQILSYFYNIPTIIILLNLPWIFLRDILVILGSVIFMRFTLLKVFLLAKIEFFKEFNFHYKIRKQNMKFQKTSSFYIWKMQKNFIITYVKYFMEYIIKNKKTNLEY